MTNAGYAQARGVVVTETYDSNFAFLEANPAPSVSDSVWNFGVLGVGMGRAIVVTGRVNSGIANGTVLTNVATLDSDQTTLQQATVTTVASNNPLLTLTKSALSSSVGPGQLLVYTIRIANNGLRDATGIVVTDTLPLNITEGSATPSPSAGVIAAGNTITWPRSTLGIGQSDAITLVVNVATPLPDGTVLTNTARVTCNEGATAFGRTTTTVYKPTLSVTKMDTPDPVVPGGVLTYTILISNASAGAVGDVAIQETYGSWFVYQSAVPAPTSGNSSWYTDTLASGQAYTLVVTGRVADTAPSGGMLLNTVTVYWDSFFDSTSTTIGTNVAYRVLLPIILKGS